MREAGRALACHPTYPENAVHKQEGDETKFEWAKKVKLGESSSSHLEALVPLGEVEIGIIFVLRDVLVIGAFFVIRPPSISSDTPQLTSVARNF